MTEGERRLCIDRRLIVKREAWGNKAQTNNHKADERNKKQVVKPKQGIGEHWNTRADTKQGRRGENKTKTSKNWNRNQLNRPKCFIYLFIFISGCKHDFLHDRTVNTGGGSVGTNWFCRQFIRGITVFWHSCLFVVYLWMLLLGRNCASCQAEKQLSHWSYSILVIILYFLSYAIYSCFTSTCVQVIISSRVKYKYI